MIVKIKTTFLFITLLFLSQAKAQNQNPTQILIVGFDHLAQLDNGTSTSNIYSNKKQNEIIKLTESLKRFKADMVMVEKEPSEQKTLDSLYRAYYSHKIKLSDISYGSSETYQVGFRLAKDLKLDRVYGVDFYESTSQSLLKEGENIQLFKNGLQTLMNTARPLKK